MAQRRRRATVNRTRRSSEPLMSYASLVSLVIIFCVGSLLLGWGSLSMVPTTAASQRVYRSSESISDAMLANLDAVLVLGGGRPHNLTAPPDYVRERCDAAAMLRKRHAALKYTSRSSLPILCLSAGTAHLPQLMAADGLPIWESTSNAAYLQHRYGLTDNVYVETTSYDTIGNAFYARVQHLQWTDWRKLLIITSDFHMNRTIAIFEWIFALDTPPSGRPYQLHYLATPDVGLSHEALEARAAKEGAGLQQVEKYATQYNTMAKLHKFLTTNHGLYTASSLVERAGQKLSDASALLKESYGFETRHLIETMTASSAASGARHKPKKWGLGGLLGRLFRGPPKTSS